MGAAERDREFDSFVAARSSALFRTAFFVTADEQAARDLLVAAFAKTRLAWGRTGPDLSVETYVRQTMFQTYLSESRRAAAAKAENQGAGAAPAAATDEVTESATPPSETDRARARLWSAWTGLAPRERAILVLGIQDELTDEEVARTLGCTLKTVRSQGADGYVALRRATNLDVQSLSRELRAEFARRASDLRLDLELAGDAHERAAVLGRRRRVRVGSAVGAVAAFLVVAIGASMLFGDGTPAAGTLAPSQLPSGSASGRSPDGTPGLSVTAVPDSVLTLARETGALLAWGAAIVDGAAGAAGSAAVIVDVEPATGASRGDEIFAVARAQSGYVVSTRTQAVLGVPSQLLSYVRRDGSRTELGRITDEQSSFAVSPDGFSVVHVISGPVQGENPIAAGESELVVQDLSGDVVNRIVVDGPVRPFALDADRVWFDRVTDRLEEPYVWDRATGAVTQVPIGRRSFAQSVRGDQLFVLDIRGRGCIRSLDVADVAAPVGEWRRCAVGYGAVLDPSATRLALVSFENGAILHLLDPRDGAPLDTLDLNAGFAGQFVWTANGGSLIVEVVTDTGPVTYLEVITSGPDGGGTLTSRDFEVPVGPVVLGTELPLPSVR